MAIVSIKIHPAIGIARVGNSPAEFFVGPEITLDHKVPTGGYKDAACRVKRQGARFRLFGYDQNGNVVQELTSADANITWTVQLTNKKAATNRNSGVTGADRAGLVIDPGSRTLNGPTQVAKFDTGTFKLPGQSPVNVPLGEIRTDSDGRLLVLGGFGTSKSPTGRNLGDFLNNDEWFDDISDGPVTATVQLRSDGSAPPVTGAWIISAPPKFAPGIDSVVTLYDRLFDLAIGQGWLQAPAMPSYARDIYKILNRATQVAAVNQSGAGHHGFTHPVIDQAGRTAIYNKLKGSGGNMPDLSGGVRLTDTQQSMMTAWKNGNFINDWAGLPVPSNTVSPADMDRAALEACVGAAFFPGIEAGGIAATPIMDASLYLEPFRLDHTKVHAGDMSANMACPWQGDFNACGEKWWPAPRPNQVIPQSGGGPVEWSRGVGSGDDMVTMWNSLGFVVQQGSAFVEVGRCDTPSITLVTSSLDFQDVPQGPNGMSRKQALAVVFEVQSTGAPVTLQFQSGPSFARLRRFTAGPLVVGPTAGSAIVPARLWITYETGGVGETVSDSVTIVHAESGRVWTIPITANTVARKKAAAALVLDHSGSMTEDRGDGVSKVQSLREAASIFVDVMLEGDGIALVRFNQTADLLAGVTALGAASDPFDPGRSNAKSVVNGNPLDPSGSTSIGAGIQVGRQALNASSGFDVDSLVVLTDGMENRSPFIADVASSINAFTYSIGLGKADNISVAALQAISGNNGGYLLVTGAISGDNRFLLQKYFLQILAGINNAEIVLDPQGYVLPGRGQVVPFPVTEADAGLDVILLTPYPEYINFRLRTPTGQIIDMSSPGSHPYIEFVRSRGVSYYRLSLPVELTPQRLDQGGTWQALLDIGRTPDRGIGVSTHITRDQAFVQSQAVATAGGAQRGLPFNVLIHAYSNLSLRARAQQSAYGVGSEVLLTATLAESGVPMQRAASVWAEVTTPSNNILQCVLSESTPGTYGGKFVANEVGVYRARVRASGTSERGLPFRREQTVTAAIWIERIPTGPGGLPADGLCHFLRCILGTKGAITSELAAVLQRIGFDINALRRCLSECVDGHIPENERAPSIDPVQGFSEQNSALAEALTRFFRPSQGGSS